MKKYKMFSVVLNDTVKQFVNYCKANNKIISKELVTAIQYYLNNNQKGGQNDTNNTKSWTTAE